MLRADLIRTDSVGSGLYPNTEFTLEPDPLNRGHPHTPCVTRALPYTIVGSGAQLQLTPGYGGNIASPDSYAKVNRWIDTMTSAFPETRPLFGSSRRPANPLEEVLSLPTPDLLNSFASQFSGLGATPMRFSVAPPNQLLSDRVLVDGYARNTLLIGHDPSSFFHWGVVRGIGLLAQPIESMEALQCLAGVTKEIGRDNPDVAQSAAALIVDSLAEVSPLGRSLDTTASGGLITQLVTKSSRNNLKSLLKTIDRAMAAAPRVFTASVTTQAIISSRIDPEDGSRTHEAFGAVDKMPVLARWLLWEKCRLPSHNEKIRGALGATTIAASH